MPLPWTALPSMAERAEDRFRVNNRCLWIIQSFFNFAMKEVFATWTILETVLSVKGFPGMLVLSAVLRQGPACSSGYIGTFFLLRCRLASASFNPCFR